MTTTAATKTATIAVLGSGFAGSILARVLARQGHRLVLVERGRHPRFALGESATPLAAIALERLAHRYDLPDLADLAAHGRWRRRLPGLGRGLKRGFTFYAHEPGVAWRNGPADERRLLVAASPDDEVADCHWLRADVDAHLARLAEREGVELLEETEASGLERAGDGWTIELRGPRDARRLAAAAVVDASGPGGFLARHLPEARRVATPLTTRLVATHVTGLADFAAVAAAGGAVVEPGPYPDGRAAVHHLLAEGWIYVLPFDDGRASVGLVLRGDTDVPGRTPEDRFRAVVARYPTLAASFADAVAVEPWREGSPVAFRCAAGAGPGWAVLPHAYAFYDPLFSTGIAWSLFGVERLARWGEHLTAGATTAAARALARHGDLLAAEADWISALVDLAWRTMADFDRFVETTRLYFAAASYQEALQRLVPEREPRDGWAAAGYLGTDPETSTWPTRLPLDTDLPTLRHAVTTLIAPRDVAALTTTTSRRLPVDLEALVTAAPKLGLDRAELRRRLPWLRAGHADA